MFEWLKDHFIPHEGNDHRPHFLRAPAIALVLAAVLLLEVAYLAGTLYLVPRSDFLAEVISSVLVEETNAQRTEESLGTLTINPLLEQAARLKAEDMAAKGYFSHDTPDGKTPWYFLREVGYRYQAAGENLAVNFTDSSDVTRAWMNSPSHRANILNGNYTEIGIATARGTYKGSDTVFVVQFFGKPRFADLPRSASATPVALLPSVESPSAPVLGTTTIGSPAEQAVLPTRLDEPPIVLAQTLDARPEIAVVPPPHIELPDENATTVPSGEPQLSFATTAEPTSMAPEPLSFFESALARILAMPRATLTAVLLSIAVLILIALVLTIFIKVRIQHPHLIANAIIVVAVIAALILLNMLLAQSMGAVR